MKIGKKLIKIRETKGITLYKVAKETNINYTTLWHIEQDKKAIGLKLLVILAKYYNVSTDFLLDLKENETI